MTIKQRKHFARYNKKPMAIRNKKPFLQWLSFKLKPLKSVYFVE